MHCNSGWCDVANYFVRRLQFNHFSIATIRGHACNIGFWPFLWTIFNFFGIYFWEMKHFFGFLNSILTELSKIWMNMLVQRNWYQFHEWLEIGWIFYFQEGIIWFQRSDKYEFRLNSAKTTETVLQIWNNKQSKTINEIFFLWRFP